MNSPKRRERGERRKISIYDLHTHTHTHTHYTCTFKRYHEYVLVEVSEWELVKEGNKVTLLQQIGVPFTVSLILNDLQMYM